MMIDFPPHTDLILGTDCIPDSLAIESRICSSELHSRCVPPCTVTCRAGVLLPEQCRQAHTLCRGKASDTDCSSPVNITQWKA